MHKNRYYTTWRMLAKMGDRTDSINWLDKRSYYWTVAAKLFYAEVCGKYQYANGSR